MTCDKLPSWVQRGAASASLCSFGRSPENSCRRYPIVEQKFQPQSIAVPPAKASWDATPTQSAIRTSCGSYSGWLNFNPLYPQKHKTYSIDLLLAGAIIKINEWIEDQSAKPMFENRFVPLGASASIELLKPSLSDPPLEVKRMPRFKQCIVHQRMQPTWNPVIPKRGPGIAPRNKQYYWFFKQHRYARFLVL